jgi:hypothetical protein
VVHAARGTDAPGMFEPGIGPGVRSNRCGTWSLITFLFLVFAPAIGGPALAWWLPLLACAAATLAAIGCGLAGLFVSGQRRSATYGLLKAAVPTVVGGAVVLFFLTLSSMNFE